MICDSAGLIEPTTYFPLVPGFFPSKGQQARCIFHRGAVVTSGPAPRHGGVLAPRDTEEQALRKWPRAVFPERGGTRK